MLLGIYRVWFILNKPHSSVIICSYRSKFELFPVVSVCCVIGGGLELFS